MKLIRTAKIKINMSLSDILPTIQAYTKAFNFVCSIGFSSQDKNGVSLHKKTYVEVRKYLPSQLAISSRMKATEALVSVFTETKHKKLGSCPISKSCSIRYDKNSYSLFLKKKQVSLLTVSGRKKYELIIPKYYQEQFNIWKYCSAELCFIKSKVYLHIAFEKEIADVISTKKIIGIDRGINNLAVVSNNKFYKGGIVKQQIKKYQKLKNALQSKITKSAKRHLKKLSYKEKRFRADINHQISKKIICDLNQGDTIVLENLTGIRNKRLRKKQRFLLNSWSYFQLEKFIKYKAYANGINVLHIDARYTSQRCSKCGFILRNNRKSQSNFLCKQCGFKLNADLNASRNICNKHLESYRLSDWDTINYPIVETI